MELIGFNSGHLMHEQIYDKLNKEYVHKIKKSVWGSLPPRTAVRTREAEIIKIGAEVRQEVMVRWTYVQVTGAEW
jgi:hypothetical protein